MACSVLLNPAPYLSAGREKCVLSGRSLNKENASGNDEFSNLTVNWTAAAHWSTITRIIFIHFCSDPKKVTPNWFKSSSDFCAGPKFIWRRPAGDPATSNQSWLDLWLLHLCKDVSTMTSPGGHFRGQHLINWAAKQAKLLYSMLFWGWRHEMWRHFWCIGTSTR